MGEMALQSHRAEFAGGGDPDPPESLQEAKELPPNPNLTVSGAPFPGESRPIPSGLTSD